MTRRRVGGATRPAVSEEKESGAGATLLRLLLLLALGTRRARSTLPRRHWWATLASRSCRPSAPALLALLRAYWRVRHWALSHTHGCWFLDSAWPPSGASSRGGRRLILWSRVKARGERNGHASGDALLSDAPSGPPRGSPAAASRARLRGAHAHASSPRLALAPGLCLRSPADDAPPRHREDGEREDGERPLAGSAPGRPRRKGHPRHVRQGLGRGGRDDEGHRCADGTHRAAAGACPYPPGTPRRSSRTPTTCSTCDRGPESVPAATWWRWPSESSPCFPSATTSSTGPRPR